MKFELRVRFIQGDKLIEDYFQFDSVRKAKSLFNEKIKEMGFNKSEITKSDNPNFMWKCGGLTTHGKVIVLEEE